MPSALHLTVPCTASLKLQESVVPTPPTFEQAEGEGGHLVARKHAEGHGELWPLGRKMKFGDHEVVIDEDMIEGAALYREEAQPNGRYEDPVTIPDVHEECWGTPDWWRVLMETYIRQLKVIDYKYGHRYVEVWRHYQLIAYAAGVARKLGLPLDFPVVLVIIQPRNYTHGYIREWKTTVGEIYRICAEDIAPRVTEALGPNPVATVGKHCIDCKARHACKTLQQSGESIVELSGQPEAHDIPDDAVGVELRMLAEARKILEARYTGLYERASNLARNNHRISGWIMEAGNGRLVWKEGVTPQKVIDVGDVLGVDVRKPVAVKTPTQCKQAGIDQAVIDIYAHRPPGALKLVPDDNVRFRKIFGANRT
jgi:hypothetical protein